MDGETSTNLDDFTMAKRWRLIGLLALSLAVGTLEQLFAESHADERAFMLGGGIVVLLLLVSWCRLDARERGFSISRPLLMAIVLFAGIGLLIYFIRTRGARGILSFAIAALFAAAMFALEQVAIEVTYYLM